MQYLYVNDGGVRTGDATRVAVAALFKALGNPTRVAIVDVLSDGPRCVHELVRTLGVDQPLVSQHLRVLRDVDLLSTERRGKEVVY
ncbi:MAG: ArsR/SmtB family transcription factor, partial [Actinomycetes bacterium]